MFPKKKDDLPKFLNLKGCPLSFFGFNNPRLIERTWVAGSNYRTTYAEANMLSVDSYQHA